ncbi:MEDS domain-containing protein [Methanothermobacter sp.]|uniref:MEDS domain-containing protein n=1 Tax=Methanothermobacter sp. TaxID=1884223 RepID=UPI003C754EC1
MENAIRRINDLIDERREEDTLSLIRDMEAGDHICIIYDDEAEWRRIIVPFIIEGLRRGERCIYIASQRTCETIREELGRKIPVSMFEAGGSLRIMNETEAYTEGGFFDPERMLDLLESETENAVAEGFTGLRVTGEMSWVLRGLPGSERLIEYEARLNNFFPGSDCLAICQYHRQLFSPDVIRGVLLTHPIVVWNSGVYRNPYYISPELILSGEEGEREVDNWLENIKRENELLRSLENIKKLYDEFINHSPWIVFLKDFRSRYVIANSRFSELVGTEDITGKTDFDLMDREAAEACLESDRMALRDGESYTEEEVKGRVYGVYKFGFKLPDGRRGVGGFAVDITQRKVYERDIETSRNNFLGIVENSPEPMVIVDLDGKLLYSNPAGRKFFGWPPDYRGGHIGVPLRREIQEIRVLSADGQVRVAEMMVTDTVWEGRKSLLIRLHDITRLREYEISLKRSLREKEVMLREIHHRVKNNLQIISSLLNLQRCSIQDERAADVFTDSVNRVKSMAMIHEKLYQSESLADLPFSEYIIDLVSEIRSNYLEKRISVNYDMEDIHLDINRAIPAGLIVNEAVTNAMKHAFKSGEGELIIRLFSREGMVHVEVEDDGPGLSADFDTDTGGGLGMDLMRNLASQLDGELRIRGDNGVRVSLVFPAQKN